MIAIVTGADCDKTFGVLPIARSEHPLARDKVRYKGEPVAAVAAVDEATAGAAVRLIKMHVRELPAYFPAQAALAPMPAPAREEARQHRARRAVRAGHVADGFAQAALVREANCNCAEVCQNQMEMHAAVADYDAVRDRLTVHASHPGALLRAPDAGGISTWTWRGSASSSRSSAAASAAARNASTSS